MDYKVRKLQAEEYHILEDFLYEAIFIPQGIEPPKKDIIYLPELQVYVKDFGGRHDLALVAEVDGKVIGAVWTRIMPDYGHIDDETPSLAISLYKEYRGMGIGTILMESMLKTLRECGFRQVSLSVQKANFAVKLYFNMGFEIYEDKDEELIMVCRLN